MRVRPAGESRDARFTRLPWGVITPLDARGATQARAARLGYVACVADLAGATTYLRARFARESVGTAVACLAGFAVEGARVAMTDLAERHAVQAIAARFSDVAVLATPCAAWAGTAP